MAPPGPPMPSRSLIFSSARAARLMLREECAATPLRREPPCCAMRSLAWRELGCKSASELRSRRSLRLEREGTLGSLPLDGRSRPKNPIAEAPGSTASGRASSLGMPRARASIDAITPKPTFGVLIRPIERRAA